MKNYFQLSILRSLSLLIVLFIAVSFRTHAAQQYEIDPNLDESIKWYIGATGKVDDGKAKTLLETAALTKDPLAVMWIARVYSTGRMGYPADKDKAKEIAKSVISKVEELAEQQVPEAIFLMGTAYAEGLGKNENSQEAVEWYRRAAKLGNTLAQHNLGNAYAFAAGIEQNHELAVKWWLKAAEQGDAIPQYQLGLSYEAGKGVAQDRATAKRWYQESAERGYAKAKIALTRLNRLERLNR
ncbi:MULTISPECIES: tetratricopeptide repeat protein [Aliiglaciecola]|uniref:tetratricopeptide repeat protein n=1 Tax=Aliiglaciecola TaxID=1406885 RepID=UPI001C096067|nr:MULTISPECIES: tetratricopeptide repeat protein [Aliiglaciecola]MBU2878368.1 sel1 repeat family protein [Aliiglaciecola lipolytica]MDO6711696.1 tetratricopeptide repeat protein [Aliiglaciecola sp. 2_MG-2023]MDO6752767.1 tetratricopeptide repeat protein [Aliiglaciecola sp. 1_MG-2023]